MMPAPEIHGVVAAGYEPVRDAFANNFERHGEVGAAFCLYAGGAPVVDIWGGQAGESAWQEDTLQLVFSTTKGATAVCANLLAQRGDLDLDAPVREYWPEFAAAGKEHIPVRWLLCHKAGLPTVDAKLSFDDVMAVTPVVEALAAQAPYWEPGTKHGYHALTYGWLVGEVVRRVSGKTLGQFFASEVAAPLGLEFWIGLPTAEERRVAPLRAAPVSEDPAVRELMASVMAGNSLLVRALTLNGALSEPGGTVGGGVFNQREVHATEMPAANGITTARSLARMYAACVGPVDGVRILEPGTVAAASKEQASGPDEVLMIESRIGTGFMLNGTLMPLLSDAAFGHAGAGGSLGFGDPDAGIGFGYVMCQMGDAISGDPRATNLVDAVRSCVR